MANGCNAAKNAVILILGSDFPLAMPTKEKKEPRQRKINNKNTRSHESFIVSGVHTRSTYCSMWQDMREGKTAKTHMLSEEGARQ